MRNGSDTFYPMINRNHAYSGLTSQTLDRASRDALVDYSEIGHMEEYFLPFIYSVHNLDLRMDNVL